MKMFIAFLLLLSGCGGGGGGTVSGSAEQPRDSIQRPRDESCDVALNTTLGIYTPPSVIGRNRVLNGAMMFDQNKDGGVYSSGPFEIYSLDQWRFAGAPGNATFDIQQSDTAPAGFQKSLKVTITKSSEAANQDNYHIEYPIEGYYIADFKWGTAEALPAVLQFNVNASVAGVYSVTFMNGINSLSYVTSYTVNIPNVPQDFEITIPGAFLAHWDDAFGFGLKIIWDLGTGPFWETSDTDAWVGQAKWRKAGTVSLAATNGATWHLTGVQFEHGTKKTEFEFIDHSLELKSLQRYYCETVSNGIPATVNARMGGS